MEITQSRSQSAKTNAATDIPTSVQAKRDSVRGVQRGLYCYYPYHISNDVEYWNGITCLIVSEE